MHKPLPRAALFLVLLAGPASAVLDTRGAAAQTTAQEEAVVQTSVLLGEGRATLDLELADGRTVRIRLEDGVAYVDGRRVSRYEPGGALETAWREALRRAAEGDLDAAVSRFAAGDYGADGAAASAILDALATLTAGGVPLTASPTAEAGGELIGADSAVVAAAAQEAAPTGEVVKGGLVVELAGVEDLSGSLRRIGLAPTLARVLNGDLEGPVRIVIEADEYLLPAGATLGETLVLVETDAVLAGTVGSNVVVAEGSLVIAPTGRVEGDVIAIDASVQNQGTIVGALREAAHGGPVLLPPVRMGAPRASRPSSVLKHVLDGLGSLGQTIAMYLLFAFLGALIVYFFRGHLETVSDTVSYSFGRSFAAGLAAEILVFPIGLVLLILIITAIVVPFYVLAFSLLGLLGYIGVAHAAGENLTRHRFSGPERIRRSNSYYYVLNGLGVLMALFVGAAITEMASPLLGWAHDLLIASAWILTWIAATAGLGAALLSRAGTQRKYARPHELPAPPIDPLVDELAPLETRRARRRGAEDRDEI
jgi:hypothetical protein